MKRVSIHLSLLAVCLFPTMQAQTVAPESGPEINKFRVLVGDWTYKGEARWTAWPRSKIKDTYDAHMILRGVFLQEEERDWN